MRFTEFKKINWDALIWHLVAGLLGAVGIAMQQGADPIHAVKLWFWGALVYIGAYIQNAEKRDYPNEPLDQSAAAPPTSTGGTPHA